MIVPLLFLGGIELFSFQQQYSPLSRTSRSILFKIRKDLFMHARLILTYRFIKNRTYIHIFKRIQILKIVQIAYF